MAAGGGTNHKEKRYPSAKQSQPLRATKIKTLPRFAKKQRDK